MYAINENRPTWLEVLHITFCKLIYIHKNVLFVQPNLKCKAIYVHIFMKSHNNKTIPLGLPYALNYRSVSK